MAQQVYKVPRLTDAQIAAALKRLAEEAGGFQIKVNVFEQSLGVVTFPEQGEAAWQALLKQDGELIGHFGGTVAGVTIHYHRGGNQGTVWERSPSFDDIAIDPQGVDEARLRTAARMLALFRPVQLPRVTDAGALVDAQRAVQEATFARLEKQLETLFEQTIDVRRQLDESVKAKEESLDNAFRRRAELAEAEHQSRKEAVERERADLDARRKELDDSDNTFARRQIRERMLADVAARVKNFGVSSATAAARKPVAVGMGLLVVFLFGLFAWTSTELVLLSQVHAAAGAAASSPLSITTERVALWVRLSLVSLGLVAALVYYIRWQNQWAQQFASTELGLQQFHIDVNRANWAVESCLEWRKETDSDIPAPLIESMTRGLFAGRDASPHLLHPADELASALMGSASKLSLDIAGNKVEIDKPSKIPKVKPVGSA